MIGSSGRKNISKHSIQMDLQKLMKQPISLFLFDLFIVILAKVQKIPNLMLILLSLLLLFGTIQSYGMFFRIAVLLGVLVMMRYVSWEGFNGVFSKEEEMELLSSIKSLVSSLNEPDSVSFHENESQAV